MNTTKLESHGAVAGQVERWVRPAVPKRADFDTPHEVTDADCAFPARAMELMPEYRQQEGGTGGGMRNRRSVWSVNTAPYGGAHFATFPPALIEPCILAGSRTGDVVLDPFMGSGTTAQVAQALGRQWIGCELNTEYAPLQQARTAQAALAI